jgi:hypothetical protein
MTNDDVSGPCGGLRQRKLPDVVVVGAVYYNVVVGIADGEPGRGVSGSIA